jgi:hypothetical protein
LLYEKAIHTVPIFAVSSSIYKKLKEVVCVGPECSICFVLWLATSRHEEKHFSIALCK